MQYFDMYILNITHFPNLWVWILAEEGQAEVGDLHGIEEIHIPQDDDDNDNEVIIGGNGSPNNGNEGEGDGGSESYNIINEKVHGDIPA